MPEMEHGAGLHSKENSMSRGLEMTRGSVWQEETVWAKPGQESGAWLRAILPVAQNRGAVRGEVGPYFQSVHPCPISLFFFFKVLGIKPC